MHSLVHSPSASLCAFLLHVAQEGTSEQEARQKGKAGAAAKAQCLYGKRGLCACRACMLSWPRTSTRVANLWNPLPQMTYSSKCHVDYVHSFLLGYPRVCSRYSRPGAFVGPIDSTCQIFCPRPRRKTNFLFVEGAVDQRYLRPRPLA